MVVEKMPEYKGGIEALVSYFGQNLSYPQEAREKKLTGTVFVSFIVNPDGSIGNPTVLKGIGSGCDEEALRVIRSMPAWNPGMQNGQPVAVKYSMPIKFSPQ